MDKTALTAQLVKTCLARARMRRGLLRVLEELRIEVRKGDVETIQRRRRPASGSASSWAPARVRALQRHD